MVFTLGEQSAFSVFGFTRFLCRWSCWVNSRRPSRGLCFVMSVMGLTPERHLPTPVQRGHSPQRHTAACRPPPLQTRGTQSHSAHTPLIRPMLIPEGAVQ